MSLVSHENIEIFVVIHEKAIQRSLKYEKDEELSIGTAEDRTEVRDAPEFLMHARRPSANPPPRFRLAQRTLGGRPLRLVEGALEDESDVSLLTAQLMGAERAGGVEGVGAVGQGDLAPVGRRLLRANVAAGVKGVSGRGCVDIKARFAAQPQRHVRPFGSTHGALPVPAVPALPLLAVVAPVVVAVYVSALEVDPGLLLVRSVLAMHGGESQRVEAHGALRTSRVDLLPQGLQVFEGGGAGQTVGGTPQQGCAAKVDERAINQLVALGLNLEERVDRGEAFCTQRACPPLTGRQTLFKVEDLQL